MRSALSAYYRGKKVFVTGHTGFKGAWLTAVLHRLGAQVKGYALPPAYANGLFDVLRPLEIAESVFGDIRTKDLLKNEISTFQPDYIFHLAAQPLVRRSYEIPAETFEINVAGTANLLEGVVSLPNKCAIVAITTDKVYENKENPELLYNEDDILGGYDPYSASKACCEIVVSSFRDSFFNPDKFSTHQKAIASARAGNVIGGGDWSADRIVPDIITSLKNQKTIHVRNPNAVRPWQHVLEPIAGYLLLARSLAHQPCNFSRPYNFGPLPADHLTVRELVENAITIWGRGTWKDVSDANAPHEAGFLKLNISRANKELRWSPRLDAAKAIEWTINWYKQPLNRQADYTFQQIEDYLSL